MKINFDDILKILNILEVSLSKDKIIKRYKTINEELISEISNITFQKKNFLKFVCSLWMIKSNYIEFVKNKILYFLHRYNTEKGRFVDLENIIVLNNKIHTSNKIIDIYENQNNHDISIYSSCNSIFGLKKEEKKKIIVSKKKENNKRQRIEKILLKEKNNKKRKKKINENKIFSKSKKNLNQNFIFLSPKYLKTNSKNKLIEKLDINFHNKSTKNEIFNNNSKKYFFLNSVLKINNNYNSITSNTEFKKKLFKKKKSKLVSSKIHDVNKKIKFNLKKNHFRTNKDNILLKKKKEKNYKKILREIRILMTIL